MTEHQSDSEKRLFAAALYSIRMLLASHVGSDSNSPEAAAAELAYALHNDALAALANEPVDVPLALSRLTRIESLLGSEFLAELRKNVAHEA